MKKELLSLFPEDIQKVLTEESLQTIKDVIDGKIELNVEAALSKQDDVYSERLKELVKIIDNDRATKLKRVVESVDKANAAKLLKLVKKYETQQLQEAKKFKKQLVSTVNAFLDEEAITSIVNESEISQAVKNTTAFNVLENLRKVLSVDSVMMKESVQEAFIDGKKQLDEKDQQIQKLQKESKELKEKLDSTHKQVFLAEKMADFPQDKAKFVKNTFSDKSFEFIKENFDYVAKLFDKNDKKQKKMIKEQAVNGRKTKVDHVPEQKVVNEKVNNKNEASVDPYLSELQKVRKF